MDGSSFDFIIIPIVVLPLLVGWLAMVFYADSHPRNKAQRAAAAGDTATTPNAPADQPGLARLPEPAGPARRADVLPLPEPVYGRQPPAERRAA
jgi:hypothetical protein